MLPYYKEKFEKIMNLINSTLDDTELLYLALHLFDTFKNRYEVMEVKNDSKKNF